MLLGGSLIPVSKAGAIDGAVVAESLTEALAVVEANYAGNLDYERVTNASIEGMLRVLDPHSNYYNKEEFLELRSQQQSEYFGIGATIAQYQGKVYIHTPFDDTPAARAGLRYGDHIVNVNGQSTQGWNSSKVSSELKGPRGTSVTVSVARPGEAKPIEVKILRDAVALPTISSAYMIRPGVGYIALRRQFARTTGDEMRESVRKLKDQGMTTLLFDLRENPGGLVQAALEVCDLFLQRGQSILTIRGRKGTANDRSLDARNPSPENLPIVTLVNGNSASASEIVAGALQDHARSVIVGEVTFGKGLVQTVYPISEGAGLTLTTAKYYTPSGRLIQRDYSGTSRYDYYLRRQENGKTETKPPQQEFLTDSGQKVFGGGGITPDVTVKPTRVTPLQFRLQEPMFLFVRELINNQVAGITGYRTNEINFKKTLSSGEFAITDAVVAAFKNFLTERDKDFHISANVVNENLDYVQTHLRYEVVTAAHGQEVAQQVLTEKDLQVKKALDEMARAKDLANKAKQTAKR
jgi:carboxyl-terminal processing protease